MLLLFLLFGASIFLLIASAIVGFFFTKLWIDYCANISNNVILSSESKCPFKWLRGMEGFTSVSGGVVHIIRPSDLGQSMIQSQGGAFSGRGVVVGSSQDNPVSILVQQRDHSEAKINNEERAMKEFNT